MRRPHGVFGFRRSKNGNPKANPTAQLRRPTNEPFRSLVFAFQKGTRLARFLVSSAPSTRSPFNYRTSNEPLWSRMTQVFNEGGRYATPSKIHDADRRFLGGLRPNYAIATSACYHRG